MKKKSKSVIDGTFQVRLATFVESRFCMLVSSKSTFSKGNMTSSMAQIPGSQTVKHLFEKALMLSIWLSNKLCYDQKVVIGTYS